ncbi:replication protein RepA [Pleomorphomonas carboxyditropha]|uniref:Pirin n=1 Tax=Pleomorphomonas carboxyditropha TaxID=2023338 RepID=A0A2G9WN85_9HYPH|nr:replication protein RepA [Pleomorphomonas carboxyditropha]PIO96166.1 hypothetical protein CJ014_26800 [Pleomorphomonas carboxyditropha]
MKTAPDISGIRDADLLAELEKARGTITFGAMVSFLTTKQAERDAQAKEAERLAALSPVKRKRAVTRKAVDTGEIVTRDNLQHIHTILALCSLPHSKQPLEVREYERRQGKASLVIEAGKLMTSTGQWELQPLPWGSRARLLLLYLCSEAIRQKSPTIEVAESLTAFIRDMGFEVTGGKNGSLNYFKQQLNALAACRLRIGVWGARGASTVDTKPFSKIDVWMPENPDQQMLWSSKITFSREFFDELSAHAMPINKHIIRAFAGSSHKIDIIYWLAWNLNRLDKPLTLSWEQTAEQFGGEELELWRFRQRFKKDVQGILSVLPKAPLRLTDKGLTISPAAPEVLAIPQQRKTKKP